MVRALALVVGGGTLRGGCGHTHDEVSVPGQMSMSIGRHL